MRTSARQLLESKARSLRVVVVPSSLIFGAFTAWSVIQNKPYRHSILYALLLFSFFVTFLLAPIIRKKVTNPL